MYKTPFQNYPPSRNLSSRKVANCEFTRPCSRRKQRNNNCLSPSRTRIHSYLLSTQFPNQLEPTPTIQPAINSLTARPPLLALPRIELIHFVNSLISETVFRERQRWYSIHCSIRNLNTTFNVEGGYPN